MKRGLLIIFLLIGFSSVANAESGEYTIYKRKIITFPADKTEVQRWEKIAVFPSLYDCEISYRALIETYKKELEKDKSLHCSHFGGKGSNASDRIVCVSKEHKGVGFSVRFSITYKRGGLEQPYKGEFPVGKAEFP